MAARALIKLGKSLFDEVLEKGADEAVPYADNIFDIGKAQTKAGNDGLFDRKAWEALDPRPDAPSTDPEVRKWYGRLNAAKIRANKEGYVAVGRLELNKVRGSKPKAA